MDSGQYKYGILSLLKIMLGLAVGLAVGYVMTTLVTLFFNFINIDKLL
jgi:hypothetical protein